jgi:two-component system cell cycle sensor histidine kinase/response regulator CckA
VREVSVRAARVVLEVLEAARIPVASAVSVLPADVLETSLGRIDWDTYVAFLDRVVEACGDVLSLEELGARIIRVPSFQFLRLAGQLVVSPRQLYSVANRMVGPAMFSNVTVSLTWLAENRIAVNGELAPGYRESTAFFRICHANVVALPRLLDLPPSVIDEQVVSGRRGRLILVPPASHTIAARLRRGTRAMLALGDAFRGVARQQAELEGSLAALRTSRQQYRELIERLPDGVLIHRGGIVIWANATVLESLGYARLDEVVGKSLLDFLPPEDRAPLAAEMAKMPPNQANDEQREYRVQRPDGTIRRLEAGSVQHLEFEGAQARLVVMRDVTEQHRLRDQLALAERMALLGRLAAGVAHEINNPLAYAHASLEVAQRELAKQADPKAIGEALARARDGTERVRGIVRDLKILSRGEDAPSEAVDLPSLLDSTLALAANAIGRKAKVIRCYGDAPPACASRGRLGQLFLNLLLNAADAIPGGGAERHEIRVSTSRDDDGRAIVEIADTGIGIAPALAERVFDPFFTTKAVGAGTGLGLAICHRIVTELGGEIGFASKPGEGATFRVALPAGVAVDAPAPDPTPKPGRGRVLVVDDEPALLRTIADLIGLTHEVVTAPSGRRALEVLGQDSRFDVILADLMMADVTGMDLFEAVSADHPSLTSRFVFMTGGAFTDRARDFLAQYPGEQLEKPFNIADVEKLLRRLSASTARATP